MNVKKGVLLVNLGTPDSPKVRDVRTYLSQFLMDPRVIDIPYLQRALLVKGIIVPTRGPKSAKLYQAIWDDQTGSPLLHFSKIQAELLQASLGEEYQVELAMRYQHPSIEEGLERFRKAGIDHLQIIPLFPQYASACAGSVIARVMQIMSTWEIFPQVSFVDQFYDNERMLEAFAQNGQAKNVENYDHVLFSFHGLPVRQLKGVDPTQEFHDCEESKCRYEINENNKKCYLAQSHATARLIAAKLMLSESQYSVCFQSRLGKAEWIQPYTSEVLKELANKGVKRILVFCPAFVADCLETIYEIGIEYNAEFKALGGDHVELVPSLNDHPLWIAALKELVWANDPHRIMINTSVNS